MTQITYYAYTKYDLALLFTLLTLIDSRLAELETDNARIGELRTLLHQSVLRYDVAYKQSTKSFLTETIDTKDTARDKLTMVIEWVARYWMKLPDEADAVRGRRVYQPLKINNIGADAQVVPSRGVIVSNGEADHSQMPEFFIDIFGPASFHNEDYTFFYNNIKDNVAKRIAAYQSSAK